MRIYATEGCTAAKKLTPFFQGTVLNELGAAEIQAYIDRRRGQGVAPATVNKELNLLSSALNFGRRRLLRWDIPNPVQSMRLREPEGRIRWISREDGERLIAAAAPVRNYLPDFIVLALNTGMRKGEILGLNWDRVDLAQGMVYLTDRDQKNGKHGSIPLNADAVEALKLRLEFRQQFCPQSPWVFAKRNGERVADIKNGFKAACEKVGIKDLNPHDLRHTFATWLVQAGVPIREVADLLRHSDIRMTMRYAHLAPNNI